MDAELKEGMVITGGVLWGLAILSFLLTAGMGNSNMLNDMSEEHATSSLIKVYLYSFGVHFTILENAVTCQSDDGSVNSVCAWYRLFAGIFSILLYFPLGMLFYYGYYKIRNRKK